MRKILLATSLTSILLLGACGNNESESKEPKQEKKQMTIEQEEKVQKEELRNLTKVLVDTVNSDDTSKEVTSKLDKAIKQYEDKTKDLKQVDTIISDPVYKSAKTFQTTLGSIRDINNFEENNSDLTETVKLSNIDIVYHTIMTLNSINEEYSQVDAGYKNEVLGKELNSDFTDVITEVDMDTTELADAMGILAIEYSEELTDEQLNQLPSKDYRDSLAKYGYTDEPDVSKNEYNSMVQDFNELAPEFLHYKEATELVSADENLSMGDIRNGIVGAKTDSDVEDYEEDTEETDVIEDEDSYTDEEEEEELKWVEDEDGDVHLEGSL
ncbi:hypothetical protein [Mammaliicoccus sciuri]|uniref:hypothetical protein n=1 Tax=Mammaliicoccus sciuri TaxID=1296 RepID=UPI00194F37E1|nr:hypothetical protein [Mammaliicoccus sciuri]